MKIIEFLQKIGITNLAAAAESHCGDGDTTEKLITAVNKSKKENSNGKDPDPSPA